MRIEITRYAVIDSDGSRLYGWDIDRRSTIERLREFHARGYSCHLAKTTLPENNEEMQ